MKFRLKKYRWTISHDTTEWFTLWRKTDFLFEKWNEQFGESNVWVKNMEELCSEKWLMVSKMT